MVTAFEFATAGRIVFGAGKLKELGPAAKQFGTTAMVVTGQNVERAAGALRILQEAGIQTTTFSLAGEPDTNEVDRAAQLARDKKCAMVIGFGGGSALDAAKAIAAITVNTEGVLEYLEVVGKGRPLAQVPLPVVAIPTTAGTGAEVTRNAVLLSPEHSVKASLRHPAMLPRIAIVDPELTYALPPEVTASTGMDALTQLIEPFVSSRATRMTDALCREAIPLAARALPRVFEHGSDAGARHDMAFASLCGGLALANAGLGAVHGFAAPIGGMFPAPHGAVCAALLAEVMRANIATADAALRGRYDEVAQLLTGSPDAHASDGVSFIQNLCASLNVRRLRDLSITKAELSNIATKAAQSSSIKGNPVPLSHEQLVEILAAAW